MKLSDYPTAPMHHPHFFILVTPVVSTAHVTEADGAALQVDNGLSHHDIATNGRLEFPLSPDARNVLKQLHRLGYPTVRFDPDGDVFEDLPQFDW